MYNSTTIKRKHKKTCFLNYYVIEKREMQLLTYYFNEIINFLMK